MNDVSCLEKASAMHFLISLLKVGGSSQITDFLYKSGIYSSTFYSRKEELIEAGLIKLEEKIIEKDGKLIKGTFISLTPLGKKVAKKLLEIKEIMEEE